MDEGRLLEPGGDFDWHRMRLEIKYFSDSNNGISANDFRNKDRSVNLNVNFILSLSSLVRFSLPFSGNYIDSYAVLTMSNNDKYYIREDEYNRIKEINF